MVATVILSGRENRNLALRWIDAAPVNTTVKLYKPGRTIPQNDRMWAMLTDVSRQLEHHGRKHSPEAWKALFMHACRHEVEFVMGLNDEPFPVGFRSSKLTKDQMSELMEFMSAWSIEKGVKFNE